MEIDPKKVLYTLIPPILSSTLDPPLYRFGKVLPKRFFLEKVNRNLLFSLK